MQIMPNKDSTNYYPNTLGRNLPKQAPKTGIQEEPYVEGKITRKKIRKTDDYTQAGERVKVGLRL